MEATSAWFPELPNGVAEIVASFASPGTYTLRGVARSQQNSASISLWSSSHRVLVVRLDPDGPDLETRLSRLRVRCKTSSCMLSGTLAISNRGVTKSLPTDWEVDTYACPDGETCSPRRIKGGPLGALAVGKTRSYQFKLQVPPISLGEIVRIVGRADPAK